MGLQTMSQMIAGFDTTMLRPDDELKALAGKAIELGVDGTFAEGRSAEEILEELWASEAGREWIADLEARKHPWFMMSTGDGFYHHHRAWADDLRLPFTAIVGYVAQLRDGRDLDRPRERLLAERERIADEYRELLATDEERTQFDGDARPLPPRVPARGVAQVLHRALGHVALLQRDPQGGRSPGRERLLPRGGRRLLPQHPRGARGAL